MKKNTVLTLVLFFSFTIKAKEAEHISTIVYKEQFQMIPPEIWIKGVESSNDIFDTVKKKINNIGDQLNYLLQKHTSIVIRNKIEAMAKGELLVKNTENGDEDGLFLAVLDDFKQLIPELSYTCLESEQLYGVAYDKVYGSCKNKLFLEGLSPDWTSCMATHFPWIDIHTTSICVVKTFSGDFLACFCHKQDGKVIKRGFCITKLECSIAQGNPEILDPRFQLIAGEECFGRMQHFLESNTISTIDFKYSQIKDNLRVRPPYHPESPCNQIQFSTLFDIGQVDVENMKAGMMVYTPGYKNVFVTEKESENESTDLPELDASLLLEAEYLTNLFEMRIAVCIISWIPGIAFLVLTRINSQCIRLRFLTNISQMLVVSFGIYNFLLPGLAFDSYQDPVVYILIPTTVQLLLNKRENTEFFLKLSFQRLVFEIPFWQTCWLIMIRDGLWDVMINIYFIIMQSYILYKLIQINLSSSGWNKFDTVVESSSNSKFNQKKKKKKQTKDAQKNPVEANKKRKKTTLEKDKKVQKQVSLTSTQKKEKNMPVPHGKMQLSSQQSQSTVEPLLQCYSMQTEKIVSDSQITNKRVNDNSNKVNQRDVTFTKETRHVNQIESNLGQVVKVSNQESTDYSLRQPGNLEIEKEKCNTKETMEETSFIAESLQQDFTIIDKILQSSSASLDPNLELGTTSQVALENERGGMDVVNMPASETLLNVPDGANQDYTDPQNDEDNMDESEWVNSCLPLTRILYKEVKGYSIEELERVVIDVLDDANSASFTIPEFKEAVVNKLEAEFWPNGIYVSDSEEDSDV